ncbi:hypothetical protein DM02DRAFT_640360 [Periconia macrospinosa]|uniref:DUF7704 domain-containing protein n=1 Tax=Periconia macrospinosa TaxID=97972 RepID=A0A2V1E082_9PLEO|nr:hypothetical protein DM02DRAFT_640360 [Periconia macrospinosa]
MPSTTSSTPLTIPLPYRILHLYLEPLMALNGAILCIFNPSLFLSTFSPTLRYTHSSQIIYDQLAATYVFLAFVEGVVLRATTELRVWKTVLGGLLVCDVLHLLAGVRCMSEEGRLLGVREWRVEDWIAVGTLLGPAAVRVAFLSGVGFALGPNPSTGR